ncbi:MAG: DUF2628 domain-containing protein [Clostridia bacterium]|nr:DUF2628 domain-containing protein [Clostridia bacterium]
MDFTGKICPYCKTEFKEGDDVVVCSVCEMPHHKECWIENKSCTTFGCTGTILGAEQYTEAVDNKRFCSKCGAPMTLEQKFCSACGNSAFATGEPHFTVAADNNSQSYQQPTYQQPTYQQPPYQQPVYQQVNPYAQQNNYQNQNVDPDLFVFLQKNQMYYINNFQQMKSKGNKTSWNWCAFLFSGYWFAYRKMYGIATACLGLNFLFSIIPVIGGLLNLALFICVGIFGNSLYQQYVETELNTAKTTQAFNKLGYINLKGGVSTGAMWASIGIYCVVSLFFNALLF